MPNASRKPSNFGTARALVKISANCCSVSVLSVYDVDFSALLCLPDVEETDINMFRSLVKGWVFHQSDGTLVVTA